MLSKEQTASTKHHGGEHEEEEQYQLNYIVNFNNCHIDTVNIKQTGKPSDPEDPKE
jgi:hypothetical protein